MTALVLIDLAAAAFGLLGFLVAFRRRAILGWMARRRDQRAGQTGEAPRQDELDPVFRMVGTMILAFSITGCAFANLLTYYAATSPN